MIDLSKPPEGATHYCDSDGCSPVYYKVGLGWAVFTEGFGWRDSNNEAAWFVKNCKPINSWTIYNNTKPLSELSDEQRGLLFNYHFNGGVIVSHASAELKSPTWGADVVYRAKQKSERELFIDLALASCDAIKLLKGDNVTLLEAMFNAGFKAPEDKQC